MSLLTLKIIIYSDFKHIYKNGMDIVFLFITSDVAELFSITSNSILDKFYLTCLFYVYF